MVECLNFIPDYCCIIYNLGGLISNVCSLRIFVVTVSVAVVVVTVVVVLIVVVVVAAGTMVNSHVVYKQVVIFIKIYLSPKNIQFYKRMFISTEIKNLILLKVFVLY